MNNPYTLRTFTFKRYGDCYEYKYQNKDYDTLDKAVNAMLRWVEKNYPSATITATNFNRQYGVYTWELQFCYKNLDSQVYWGAYGKTFTRYLKITWVGKKAYEKITTL